MFGIKNKRIWLKLGTFLVSVLLIIPISQIYQANIQNIAKEKGLDKIYEKGVGVVMESAYGFVLLAIFFILLGASFTMFIEDVFKKKNTVIIPRVNKINKIIKNKVFRNEI